MEFCLLQILGTPKLTKCTFSTLRRHSENVHELFYLQSGGNMMDYPVWKKKTKTPQFLAFHKAHQLDTPKGPSTSSSSLTSATSTTTGAAAAAVANTPASSGAPNTATPSQQTTSQHRVLVGGGGSSARMSSGSVPGGGPQRAVGSAAGQQQPHGAEIKIPGVGVTPVAVSTTLPAAVVQLSQQGRTRETTDTIFISGYWFNSLVFAAP